MTDRLVVATDGSVKVGTVRKGGVAAGRGGWAWYESATRWAAGCVPRATNQEMELRAVVEALAAHPGHQLEIVTDSKYVINCATVWLPGWRRRGWRTANGPVKHRPLIEAIAADLDRVQFRWVRGHTGHRLNTRADELADRAARTQQPATRG